MERTEIKDLNRVIIQGPIVRKSSNDIATNFTIKTPRLNMPNVAKEGSVCYNYPEIACYGVKKALLEAFKEGDTVTIEGMLQTQRKKIKGTEREYHDQKIVGLSITEAPKELAELGYESGSYEEPKNKVMLVGTISKVVSPAKGVLTINIRTFLDGRVNNIQTFLYAKNLGSYLDEYRVGDRVCAVGSIQTLKKESQDGDRYYKNVILSSLCKA